MSDALPTASDLWLQLKSATPARIGLGRTGVSVPTGRQLEFQLAHAAARDAVYDVLDTAALERTLADRGFPTIRLHSAVPDRTAYLRRPDLGRRLNDASREKLKALPGMSVDLAFVIADGLSATAVNRWAAELTAATVRALNLNTARIAPIALVEQGRVAIADEIGAALGASIVVMLIGERPGLSAADSLGVYVTWSPKSGRVNAERNCISNVRAEGLAIPAAAAQLAALVEDAKRHRCTGVALSQTLQLNVGSGQIGESQD